jgi:SseB protein N-terminal domain
MTNAIESAIARYSTSRSENTLGALERALIQNSILVPVLADVTKTAKVNFDIPVICLRTSAGDGAIPAFTTVDQLLNWKPEGCKYVTLSGKALLEMALGMPEISEIVINVNGAPRGAIPQSEFKRLVALG